MSIHPRAGQKVSPDQLIDVEGRASAQIGTIDWPGIPRRSDVPSSRSTTRKSHSAFSFEDEASLVRA